MEQAASTRQASFPRSVRGREKYFPARDDDSALLEGEDNSMSAIYFNFVKCDGKMDFAVCISAPAI